MVEHCKVSVHSQSTSSPELCAVGDSSLYSEEGHRFSEMSDPMTFRLKNDAADGEFVYQTSTSRSERRIDGQRAMRNVAS